MGLKQIIVLEQSKMKYKKIEQKKIEQKIMDCQDKDFVI